MDTGSNEPDIQAAAPPLVAVIAGRVGLVLGVFTLLLGVQTLSNMRFASWHVVLPILMLPLGAGSAVSGWSLSRGRGWAAIAMTALAPLTGLFVSVWTVLALTWGYFSLLSPMVAFAALVTLLLAALSIGVCRRSDRARAQLLAQGFDLGV
jgi:hypothetical protein